jgi:alpha/beta superfamily hydrolase
VRHAIPVTAPPGEAPFALEAELAGASLDRVVVVCHPHPAFGGRLDTPLVVALADGFERAGWASLRFNFRGLGRSGGRATGGLAEHEDVHAAIDWARRAGAHQVALCAYSFGGLMSAKAIALGAEVVAHVAVGLPTTIVGEDPERVALLERSLTRGVPTLYLVGDQDQFSELDRVAAWVRRGKGATLVVLKGEGHFFAGAAEADVVARAVEFVRACW